MITCQYCKTYAVSKTVESQDNRRLCYTSLKLVTCQTEYCKFFRLIDIFYCFSESQRRYTLACLERQVGKFSNFQSCKKCSQGELIKTMYSITNNHPKFDRVIEPIYLKIEDI